MEAVRTSESSVHFNVTTRRYILEDSNLHTRRRENLKSHNNRRVQRKLFKCYRHVSIKRTDEHERPKVITCTPSRTRWRGRVVARGLFNDAFNSTDYTVSKGRGMARAVSRRHVIGGARIRKWYSPRGTCGGQSGTRTDFSPSSSPFHCQYHSTVTLRSHVSHVEWKISPMVSAVQRHSLTPST
jgi:hypothetical protein